MSDDQILAAVMRRIIARGVRVTWGTDCGTTVTLDDSPYSVTPDEIKAMRRAAEADALRLSS